MWLLLGEACLLRLGDTRVRSDFGQYGTIEIDERNETIFREGKFWLGNDIGHFVLCENIITKQPSNALTRFTVSATDIMEMSNVHKVHTYSHTHTLTHSHTHH